MKSRAAAVISASMVSIRFLVNGPVSLISCVPSGFAQECRTPRGSKSLLEFGVLGVVRVLRLLLCVQMVEVAKELVETMNGWQELVPIAKMILAELPSRITQGL